MKIRDIVRTAVIKTNPYWPFSSLNKVPYYVAIKAFVQLCKRFRGIKSIYLRHGLVQGDWIPAISDIDLTVIIDSNLRVEQEFLFLRSFWQGYRGIKKLFPMIGEVEILNDEQLGTWTKFGARAYEAPGWRLVYGAEESRSGYIPVPVKLTRDYLNYALWIYLRYFMEFFVSRKESPYLVSQDLKRLRSKILRCLDSRNRAVTRNGACDPLSLNIGNVEVFGQVLNSLDEEICRFNADSIPMANTERPVVLERNDPLLQNDEHIDLNGLARLDGAIKSVVVNSFNKIFVVLETALDAPTLKTCFEAMSRVFPEKNQMPVIVNASMFEYMLRHYEPFEYAPFVRRRKVLFGEDLLSNIPAPSRDAFSDFLLARVPNLLTFPRSYAVTLGYAPTSFRIRELEGAVEQCLLLRLYLEKGVVRPWYHELRIECEKRYPEQFVTLRALKESRDANLAQEWFGLLRGLSNDVQNCLGNSASTEHF